MAVEERAAAVMEAVETEAVEMEVVETEAVETVEGARVEGVVAHRSNWRLEEVHRPDSAVV